MPILLCPECDTMHRVTVAQGAYRQLPCKRCGAMIPLSLAEASSAFLKRLPDFPLEAKAPPEPAASSVSATDDDTALAWGERIRLSAENAPLDAPVAVAAVPPEDVQPAAMQPAAMQPAAMQPAAMQPAAMQPAPDAPARNRHCSRCHGAILPGATKCPHCRRFLAGNAPQSNSLSRTLGWAIGIALLAIALLVTLLYVRAPVPQ